MRILIVTLSAALMLLSIAPQAGAAKSQLKCGGDNLQCGSLAKVCNPKNCHRGTSMQQHLPHSLRTDADSAPPLQNCLNVRSFIRMLPD